MKKILATLAGATAFFATHANAADISPVMNQKDWFVKIGGTFVMPSSSSNFILGNSTASNAWSGSVEAGRYISNRFSLSVAVGIPPKHDILLNGIKRGDATIGAAAFLGQFHLLENSPLDLYVGAGVGYNAVFGYNLGGVTGIDGGFAPVLQAGVEYRATESIGVFIDAKKEFFSANVHTNPANFNFTQRLDPLAVTAGIAFHF